MLIPCNITVVITDWLCKIVTMLYTREIFNGNCPLNHADFTNSMHYKNCMMACIYTRQTPMTNKTASFKAYVVQ